MVAKRTKTCYFELDNALIVPLGQHEEYLQEASYTGKSLNLLNPIVTLTSKINIELLHILHSTKINR